MLSVLLAAPALAHPLGLPATARIVRTAEAEVTIRWAAQPDDIVALAVAAGRPPTGLENGPNGQPIVPVDAALLPVDDEALATSDELAAYVTDRLAVAVDDGPCVGTLRPQPTVQVHGVEVVFACPGPADVADVTVGMLHDLDVRYRTLAGSTGPGGEVTTFFAASAPIQRLPLLEVGTLPATAESEHPEISRGASIGTGADMFGGVGGVGGIGRLDELIIAAIERPAGGIAWLVGLLVAAGVGAVHALAPGHGKAIAAAYLVGERGRRRDAVVLGTAVAAMHTGSVLVLGFALWRTVSTPNAARLGAAIETAAGATFVALGAWLLWTRSRDATHGHSHGHASVALAEGHDVATDRTTTSRVQRLVALGAAGGLLPSPSALVVLLTALFLERTGYGLALVAAFSVGMAVVLSSVGFAVLAGRNLAVRHLPERLHGLLHAAPALGAAAVVVLGGVVLARGVLRLT